jgi:hypothetical protein
MTVVPLPRSLIAMHVTAPLNLTSLKDWPRAETVQPVRGKAAARLLAQPTPERRRPERKRRPGLLSIQPADDLGKHEETTDVPNPQELEHARKRAGKRSRDKGARVERKIVHLLRAYGFPAEKVSAMYRPGCDVVVPVAGRFLDVEVKARANGFGTLYRWLTDRDALIIKADRKPPLLVIPLELAAEIASPRR